MNDENAPEGGSPNAGRPPVAGILVLLIGVAIGYYLGTQVWPPEKPKVVRMAFDPLGNLTVHAKQGTQVEWYTANQPHPVAVKFRFGQMPCTDPNGPANGKCTLKDNGTYLFNCIDPKVCGDPGVGGGDDALPVRQTELTGSTYLQPPYATPQEVNVYCDQSTNVSMADSPVHGPQGSAFFMNLVGTSFTATFPAGVCDTSDPHNQNNPNCRITAAYNPNNPQSNVYTYNITVDSCTLGHSTLTVDMPAH